MARGERVAYRVCVRGRRDGRRLSAGAPQRGEGRCTVRTRRHRIAWPRINLLVYPDRAVSSTRFIRAEQRLTAYQRRWGADQTLFVTWQAVLQGDRNVPTSTKCPLHVSRTRLLGRTFTLLLRPAVSGLRMSRVQVVC